MADAVETNAQVSKEMARAVLKLNGRIGGLEERVCAVRRYFLLATAPPVEAHAMYLACMHAQPHRHGSVALLRGTYGHLHPFRSPNPDSNRPATGPIPIRVRRATWSFQFCFGDEGPNHSMIPSLAPVNAYSLRPNQIWCPKPNLNPARRAIIPQRQMQRLEDLMGDLKVALRAAISTTDSAPDGAASH